MLSSSSHVFVLLNVVLIQKLLFNEVEAIVQFDTAVEEVHTVLRTELEAVTLSEVFGCRVNSDDSRICSSRSGYACEQVARVGVVIQREESVAGINTQTYSVVVLQTPLVAEFSTKKDIEQACGLFRAILSSLCIGQFADTGFVGDSHIVAGEEQTDILAFDSLFVVAEQRSLETRTYIEEETVVGDH